MDQLVSLYLIAPKCGAKALARALVQRQGRRRSEATVQRPYQPVCAKGHGSDVETDSI